ncbi:Golgi resident protein GCP60 [Lethenteron reissneri]|uniref:Golgi resident protein GCP60 n=1 Tax=Lethenteron reissneri TaxID=7753 RepID=UPI002AB60104|nr:Golgi resident protein GCP60 [Lethenteron reissneri]
MADAAVSQLEVAVVGMALSPSEPGPRAHDHNHDHDDADSAAALPGAAEAAGDGEGTAETPEGAEQKGLEVGGDGGDGDGGDGGAVALEEAWGFPVAELYRLALKFYREKDGKAFHLSYADKLKLVALSRQVSAGPFSPDSSPDVGYLDVLGNDRRREWAALGDMSKEDAMVGFVNLLNGCCQLFAPYTTSHRIQKQEQERIRREQEELRRQQEEERERARQEEERRRLEEEERERREEELRQRADEERLRQEQQKQQIMAALNAQTAAQFQHYAAQQYPGNYEQQQALIAQLQEQHYQQYMAQLYQIQMQQQQAALLRQQQHQQQNGDGVAGGAAPQEGWAGTGDGATQLEDATIGPTDPAAAGLGGPPGEAGDTETAEEGMENGPSDLRRSIAAPSMWTRPQIADFKMKVRQDADSVLTVGRGEVLTVRVPTHRDGAYLFWEFATDHYDIGFGVLFEWNAEPPSGVSVHVSESSEDDEEEEAGEGGSVAGSGKAAGAKAGTPKPVLGEVVPVYRRDCYTEVYAGSHQYPGTGTYLLKFDNSYSLWRAKTVYYRVYYTR